MSNHTCGTCGWDFEGNDEENRAALDRKVLDMLTQTIAAHPEIDWSVAQLKRDLETIRAMPADEKRRRGWRRPAAKS